MRLVVRVIAATALSLLSVSCATTSNYAYAPRHTASDSEVETAIQDAERRTLARMTDSVDPQTAQVARKLSLAESR